MPFTPPQPAGDADYDHLLRSNLERVFNERDSIRRNAAIAELFVADPVLYEPQSIVRGRDAISRVVGELLEQFGPSFAFVPEGTALGHHGVGMIRWRSAPAGGPSGSDVAEIIDGRIARLWVFISR